MVPLVICRPDPFLFEFFSCFCLGELNSLAKVCSVFFPSLYGVGWIVFMLRVLIEVNESKRTGTGGTTIYSVWVPFLAFTILSRSLICRYYLFNMYLNMSIPSFVLFSLILCFFDWASSFTFNSSTSFNSSFFYCAFTLSSSSDICTFDLS